LAANLGAAAAPMLGLALVAISYNWLFWGEAAAALSFAIVAAIALPRSTGDEPGNSAVTLGATAASPVTRFNILGILQDTKFVFFLIATFIFSLIYVQYLATLPLAVRAAGMSDTIYGTLVAINGVIVVAFELLATKVVQHWDKRFAVVLGMLLVTFGMSSYSAPLGVAGLIIATLIWSSGEIVAGPTMAAYPARCVPPEFRGRSLGLFNAVFGLGTAVGPIVGVAVWNEVGRQLWLWCGAIGIAACAAAWCGIQVRATGADRPPEGGRYRLGSADRPTK
ncbi:MAG: MFS transporter, partial [Mycobacteriales bacterium]